MNPSDATHLTDQELLRLYRRDKNNEWLGVLFDRYLHLIFGVCMKYLRDEQEARDEAQQVCLQVLHALPRHRVTYFKSWLYQVAKNHCLMRLRRTGRERMLPLDTDSGVADMEASSMEEKRDLETKYAHLGEAMKHLNEAQRRCLELFYLQKKTYQEVATELGYSLLEVKSHIQNGKRNLRLAMERMDREGETDRGGGGETGSL